MGGDRDEFIRERMRRDWGARSRHYAVHATSKNRVFAEILVGLVDPAAGERVLDVATGPGVVALEAARAVGTSGRVVATDLAPEWEAVITEVMAEAGIDNVEFRTMGAEALALADESFDVALCQFGLMFMPDPVRAPAGDAPGVARWRALGCRRLEHAGQGRSLRGDGERSWPRRHLSPRRSGSPRRSPSANRG